MSINSTHIHWFRHDLRLDDQPFLSEIDACNQFFGVFVLDPREFRYLDYGFRKMSLARLQFLREHLCELQQELRQRGSDLCVIYGYPEQIIPVLIEKYNANLSYGKGYATEERSIEKQLSAAIPSDQYTPYDQNFLWPEFSPVNNFPNSFSGYRKKAEKSLKNKPWNYLPAPIHLPPAPHQFNTIKISRRVIHPLSAVQLRGGCKSAKTHLLNYLFRDSKARNYKETRNELVGQDYSSKWSVYLASGALSPNIIMRHLKQFEQEVEANKSTYWLFFELLWRDYFRHAGKFYHDQLFHYTGITGYRPKCDSPINSFQKWQLGKTSHDFINAAMIELLSTGYMSNRARQNAASFLVHDPNIDWRKGAAWFEHHLLDYDVYSNQGNWMYITGVGFDPRGGRQFDIDFQAKRYDENGTFRQRWL